MWQPYCSLLAAGVKGCETRSWPTRYRGPLAIHAAKRWDAERAGDARWAADLLPDLGFKEGTLDPAALALLEAKSGDTLGRILALCDLVDCVRVRDEDHMMTFPEPDRIFGDLAPGRYAWIVGNVRPLPASRLVQAVGKQGLWTPDDMTFQMIHDALAA